MRTKIFILLFLLLIVLIPLSAWVYTNLSKFTGSTKPPNLTGTPVKITLTPQNYGFKAGDLTLPCPVQDKFCPSQKLVNINQSSAVSYKAASQSGVLNLTKVQSSQNIAVSENQDGKKYFYESVAKDADSCYTIAYTLPSDAVFGSILDSSVLNSGSKIATLGSNTFNIEGQDVNVLIQVRNTPMDPGLPCSLIKKSPDFFKAFN
ncbi:MAG: hypothetical protein Q7R49_00390 [Candidatus Daviesbacteria bacterium]|nr:hypothetical protein [Candidatus Daviesbacteria bacterium]